MLEGFLAFIEGNSLFEKKDKVLLAVSGGVDSVVMAHLFKEAGCHFAVAHCNFNLRGTDSDEDEQFVKALAENIDVKFYCKQFDTKKYASDQSVSTQVAARELRYRWFNELLDKQGYKFLATAHHLNDSLETVLYNFVKGTGIAGLRGIPVKNKRIVRPLLFATRDEIESFARSNALSWREDISNQSNDYSRNLLRNEVLPLLKKINPGLEKTFENTSLRMQQTARLVEELVEGFRGQYVQKTGEDVRIAIRGLEQANIVLIDELLKPYGFNISQLKGLKAALHETGKIFISDTHRLNVDRTQVILSKNTPAGDHETFIKRGQTSYKNRWFRLDIAEEERKGGVMFKEGVAALDARQLKFPLKVRKWREGDYFYPLGMSGKKKLSDFMIDNKIPLNLKERVHVLESDGEIAWVIGYRLDDRFKVTTGTKHIMNFRLTKHD